MSTTPKKVDLPTGPSRPAHHDGDRLVEDALPRALELAGAVRDEGHEAVATVTDPLARDELVALVVVLAAMVDVESTAAELLGWTTEPTPEEAAAMHRRYLAGDDGRRLRVVS